MHLSPVLGQLVLGYSPVMGRGWSPVATRLTVFPEPRHAEPDARGLLAAVRSVWPEPAGEHGWSPARAAPAAGAASDALEPVLLNIASEPWLRAMLDAQPSSHVMLEVPAFMATATANEEALRALHRSGNVLVFKGRPVSELPAALAPCFRFALVDGDEAMTGPGAGRAVLPIQTGTRALSDLDTAFSRGAVAALGWPLEGDVVVADAEAQRADLAIVAELIRRVDAEEPVPRLEAVLRREPRLAFLLIRQLNSAAFGLPVGVSSIGDAIMLLGYRRFRRWLALLLVSAQGDPATKPLIFATVRRGFVMEELAGAGSDAELRSDMFICGVFSLLDRILGRSFAELFGDLAVSERVKQALIDGAGPCMPYLALALALEQGVRSDILEAADRCLLGLGEVNAALLRALAAARSLE